MEPFLACSQSPLQGAALYFTANGGDATPLEPVAKRYKHRLVFSHVPYRDDRLMKYLAVTDDMLPTLVAVDTSNHQTHRFHMTPGSRATTPAMAAHVEAFLDGALDAHFLSQPEDIPRDDENDPVAVLVGTNYEKEAMKQDRSALVMVYAPWCGHSRRLAVVFREVAAHYAGREDILVAKMDGTQNEVKGLDIHGFPTLKVGGAFPDAVAWSSASAEQAAMRCLAMSAVVSKRQVLHAGLRTRARPPSVLRAHPRAPHPSTHSARESTNEVTRLACSCSQLFSFPLQWYGKGVTSILGHEYTGKRTLEAFRTFVDKRLPRRHEEL